MICICLIGHLVPQRGAILKATLVVVIFKMLLSPQSPFMAYVAVLFQGLCGELLFARKKYFKIACYLLAFLALIESAFQRVLIMTILFGKNFWEAINEFITKLTNSVPGTNYSLYFVSVYVALHLLAAFFIGKFTGNLPAFLEMTKENQSKYKLNESDLLDEIPAGKKKKRIPFLFIIWIILGLIFLQSYFFPEKAFLPKNEIALFIFRSALLLMTWYFILAPLLLKLLKSILEKQKGRLKEEMEETMLLLPATKRILMASWKKSESERGLRRIGYFWRCLIANAMVK